MSDESTVEKLDWKKADLSEIRAQGLRRVYVIKSELLGDNRFRPCIRRGAVTYSADFSFENLDDAKAFCQSDHDSILEVFRQLETQLKRIKHHCLTTKDDIPRALAHIVRLCIDVGITQSYEEIEKELRGKV